MFSQIDQARTTVSSRYHLCCRLYAFSNCAWVWSKTHFWDFVERWNIKLGFFDPFIPSEQPSDLLRLHGLRFITSSVHLKAAEEKAALEKAAREKAAQEEAAAKEIARLEELEQSSPSPEAISARPVNVPKHSRVFSLFRNTTVHESEPLPSSLPLMDELCVECQSKLVSPVDTKVSANTSDSPVAPESHEDIVSSISAEAQPLHSCPCDWFICEEELSKTLNLSIKVCRITTILSRRWHPIYKISLRRSYSK